MIKAQALSNAGSQLNIQQFQKENDEFGKYLDDLLSEHHQEGEKNNKEKAEDNALETYDLSKLCVTNIEEPPFEIKFQDEIKDFLNRNVLRGFHDKNMTTTVKALLFSKGSVKLLRQLFWAVILHKFPLITQGADTLKLLLLLRKKISRTYLKLFTLLPKQNDEIVNSFVFAMVYIIHFSIHKYFPTQRKQFNARFILDCYHIGLFELNGVLVSDYYIQQSFEKIFLPNFLTYDSDEPLKVKYEPSNLRLYPEKEISPTINTLMNTSPRGIPPPWSLIEFRKELLNTLRPKGKKEGQNPGNSKLGALSMNFGNPSVNTLSKPQKSPGGGVSQSTTSLNSKKINSKKPFAGRSVINLENEDENKGEFYLTEVKSEQGSFKGSYKFNCSQISPTISSMLENESMSLPYTQRKMMNYTMDKPHSKADLLHVINYLKEEKAQKKARDTHVQKEKLTKKNNLEAYGLSRVWEEDHGKYTKYLRNQQELRYILDNTQQNLADLPSFKTYSKSNRDFYVSRIKKDEAKEAIAEDQQLHNTDKQTYDRLSLKSEPFVSPEVHIHNSVLWDKKKSTFAPDKLPRLGSLMMENEEKLSHRQNEGGPTSHLAQPMHTPPKINENTGSKWTRGKTEFSKTIITNKDETDPNKKLIDYLSDDGIENMIPIEGRGRKKVNLLQLEKEFEKKETKLYDRDEVHYKNKRKDYKRKFVPMFSDDTDMNISNLIHNILQKKNVMIKSINSKSIKK